MKKIYLPLFSQIQGSKQKTLDRNDIWTIMQQIRVYEYTCMYIYIYITVTGLGTQYTGSNLRECPRPRGEELY